MPSPLGLLSMLAIGVLGVASPSLAQEAVAIDSGQLQGVTAAGVTSFKGVPYATPPVGALRWRPPAPVQPWQGVRVADKYGPICMQKLVKDNGVGPGPVSEDCLTLNVFAPAGPHRALPVMVWIHGGGLVNGSSSADLYDASALARQGVVVVTLNYRLGRFGFFAHPALTAEAHGGDVGNYGLMDQLQALKWVRRNIGAFGGDKSNVTIFGESAGGTSVNRLMMMRQARGLFSKAIVESGLGSEHGQTLAQAEAEGAAFAADFKVAPGDVAALRAIPADAIVAAGEIKMGKGEAPIIDGRLITENPMTAFAAGREAHVPYLAGSNSLEIPAAWAPGFKDAVKFTPEQVQTVQQAYGSPAAYQDKVLTDVVFAAPGRALAKAHAATGAPTYLYRFSVTSPYAAKTFGGAIHASDRQYVFQTLNASPWPTDDNDAAQAAAISAYWVAFAKTGDPNGGGRPNWPVYGASDVLMDFTNAGPVAKTTPDQKVLDQISAIQAAH